MDLLLWPMAPHTAFCSVEITTEALKFGSDAACLVYSGGASIPEVCVPHLSSSAAL